MRPRLHEDKQADPTYFQTSPRDDDRHKFFEKGYGPYLEWARQPKAPLLFLTGPSGTGKSSLLSAYLKPRLADPASSSKTTLLVVRSYEDPLATLKIDLVKEETGLWKKPPLDYDSLSPLDALHRAVRQLEPQDRLLIAFDQFEEFFLLRLQPISDTPKTGGKATFAVAEVDLAPLREFFHAFLEAPPARVTLLLSYRDDHHPLLAPLRLPSRNEDDNAMRVEPLDFPAAAQFLCSCPGMEVPEARMDRVLREATRQEGTRAVMRPIVANLLGIILRQMAKHPTLWERKGDLLRGYVRDCLGAELTEENTAIFRAMLTDYHTAKPRPAAEIAAVAGTDVTSLDVRLARFQRDGLVRCLNKKKSVDQRKWQITHDFLATLIERVLDGTRSTIWRTVQPRLAPVMLLVLLALVPHYVTTPKFAWHSIPVERADTVRIEYIVKPAGQFSVFAMSETGIPFADAAGHLGKDVDITIAELTDDGRNSGELRLYKNFEGEILGIQGTSGSFNKLGEADIAWLKLRLGYVDAGDGAEGTTENGTKINYEAPEVSGVANYFSPIEHAYDKRRAFQIRGVSSSPPSPIFHTENGGVVWTKTGDVLISTRHATVWDIAGASGVTFVGAPVFFNDADFFSGGLYRTTDYGKNWLEIKPTPDAPNWGTLTAASANRLNPDEIVVALNRTRGMSFAGKSVVDHNNGGVWFSPDKGESWQPLGLEGRSVSKLIVVSSEAIFAQISDGSVLIYKRRTPLDRLLGRYDSK